jgi:hypothetical protein
VEPFYIVTVKIVGSRAAIAMRILQMVRDSDFALLSSRPGFFGPGALSGGVLRGETLEKRGN